MTPNIFERLAIKNQQNNFISDDSISTKTDNESKQNIFEKYANIEKEKNNFGFIDTLKDVGE